MTSPQEYLEEDTKCSVVTQTLQHTARLEKLHLTNKLLFCVTHITPWVGVIIQWV